MKKSSKIFIAGHNGMVGSAILRRLEREGFSNFILRSSRGMDLRKQNVVFNFFEKERPDFVFLAAAKVGGIHANSSFKADFIYDNLTIQSSVIHAAYKYNVKKLLFLGSSCIYPKDSAQPIKERALLTGPLESTNDAYAIAKIAGIKMCQAYNDQFGCNFISLMPTNLYGPNDNYDLISAHVLPALIRKISEAKRLKSATVEIWGTGTPRREFLHVDDLADACFFLMENYDSPDIINVGSGMDMSITEVASIIKSALQYQGSFNYNFAKPDGTMKKLLDSTKINSLGWAPSIDIYDGINQVSADYERDLENRSVLKIDL